MTLSLVGLKFSCVCRNSAGQGQGDGGRAHASPPCQDRGPLHPCGGLALHHCAVGREDTQEPHAPLTVRSPRGHQRGWTHRVRFLTVWLPRAAAAKDASWGLWKHRAHSRSAGGQVLKIGVSLWPRSLWSLQGTLLPCLTLAPSGLLHVLRILGLQLCHYSLCP